MPSKLAAGTGGAGFVFGPFADVPQLLSADRDPSAPGDDMTPMISPPPASAGPTSTTSSPEEFVGPVETTPPTLSRPGRPG
ncbi:MAG: hypothetical protein LC792_06555 [Actinobacteria bacterium]|nr:hypothetical protein [Actinomycetota bacterium]